MLAIDLIEHLEQSKPKRILEIGSGVSTVLFADFAARHGREVVTLEHDSRYEERTKQALTEFGLADHVDLRLAPLRLRRFEDGKHYPWYKVSLDGEFDFIFIDGPPKRAGRQGVFFAIFPHLSPTWEVWLDDGLRNHEKSCVKLWQQHYHFANRRGNIDGKGAWVLRPSNHQKPWAPECLEVAILAGDDPKRLRRIVVELFGHPLLRDSQAVVAVEDNPRMSACARSLHFIDRWIACPSRETPAERLGRLFGEVTRDERVQYVLQLEACWSARTLDPSWLWRAIKILEDHPGIEQVSLLRSVGSGLHTKTLKRYSTSENFLHLGQVRFDLTPSLVRASVLAGLRRSSDTAITGRRLRRLKLETAQLKPGVFDLIGKNGQFRVDSASSQTEWPVSSLR